MTRSVRNVTQKKRLLKINFANKRKKMSSKVRIPITTDNQGAREQQASTIFPTLIERTERHVALLLAIVSGLEAQCFTVPEGSQDLQTCDPELAKKALATASLALGQLDNIVEDMSRWDASGGALEQSYGRYLETAAKLSETHLFSVAQSVLPHVRYKATLLRVDVNDWVALIGAGTNREIIGRGPTVHDALRDFDKNFLHGFDPSENVVELARVPKQKPVKKSSKRS